MLKLSMKGTRLLDSGTILKPVLALHLHSASLAGNNFFT